MNEIERILSLLVNTALNSKTKKDKPALLVKEFAGKFEDLIDETIDHCEEETRLEKLEYDIEVTRHYESFEDAVKNNKWDVTEKPIKTYNQAISDTKDKFNKLREGKE